MQNRFQIPNGQKSLDRDKYKHINIDIEFQQIPLRCTVHALYIELLIDLHSNSTLHCKACTSSPPVAQNFKKVPKTRLKYNCAHLRSTKESLTFEYLDISFL